MNPLPWPTFTKSESLPAAYEALRDAQASALSSFPWPTRASERWKYADLQFLKSASLSTPSEPNQDWIHQQIKALKKEVGEDAILLVMVNGIWDATLSSRLPVSLTVENLKAAMQKEMLPLKMTEASLYPFAALNQAFMEGGMALTLMKGDLKIHVLSLLSSDVSAYINQTVNIILGEHVKLQLVEHVVSDGRAFIFGNQVAYLSLGAESHFSLVKYQAMDAASLLLSHYEMNQGKNSEASLVNLSQGARFARDEVIVHLNEPGSRCSTSGLYCLTRDKQFIDNHIEIKHAAPHTQSYMLYKGILDNTTQAVFNGHLLVKEGAKRIEAYQANHHLLLSNKAEAYAKPELEIYTDDVKCKHGATTGQLDEEALFYLRSRGISKDTAKAMLMTAFMQEVWDQITDTALRSTLIARMAA